MKVSEAIEILSKCDPDVPLIVKDGSVRLPSCGSWMHDAEISEIKDLETRVVIFMGHVIP
jgi:hypothetical protein